MIDFDLTFFTLASCAVLFAGVSKGGFGSGAAFAAVPFLALILEPATAVAFMLPMLMLQDVTSLRPYWRKWDWPCARVLMISATPGVVLGYLFFGWADDDLIRVMIGVIAVGFVLYRLSGISRTLQGQRTSSYQYRGIFWGMLSGFTSFVSHAGGPPSAIYLLGQNLSKERFQATTVIVFWWVNLIKLIPYTALGLFSRETLMANLILAPVAVAGALLGVAAHRVISETIFFRLTYVFLTITGSKLIFDGLS